MANTEIKEKKLPKGGRKGGRIFPRYPLKEVAKWVDKLVSKTYNAPQPEGLIKAGVVEARYGTGNMRISALKQFDLMEGSSKGYAATLLAKEIRNAPHEEKSQLYRKAALKPRIFKEIFETFQGDSVPLAKISQRAAELYVHPDAAANCADVYVETMEFAGLLTRNGDLLVHITEEPLAPPGEEQLETEQEIAIDDQSSSEAYRQEENGSGTLAATRRGVATVQVNINLDSSLDTEKLQRQLELLRRYGAL